MSSTKSIELLTYVNPYRFFGGGAIIKSHFSNRSGIVFQLISNASLERKEIKFPCLVELKVLECEVERKRVISGGSLLIA